jgi:hypothetical protein
MAAGVPEFLVAWKATQSDLLVLVGTRFGPFESTRLDPPPRVTFFQVSGDRVRGLAGPMMVARQRWQINCIGSTPTQARLVARYITGATGDSRLDGYRGTLGGITVQSCILVDERDDSEPQATGSDVAAPSVSLDFDIAWNTV